MFALFAAVALQLTFRDVIAGIPHDAGALVAYVILGAFAYGVWRGTKSNRSKKPIR